MVNPVGHTELYRIINRAISRCSNHENAPVNTEIAIFAERYNYLLQHNRQLDAFEDAIPQQEELNKAASFCDMLEDYRLSTDIYAKENEPLSEKAYRCLHAGIDCYRQHIYPENQTAFNVLEYNVKRHLPEFKDELVLSEYNRKASRIHDLKVGYDRQRRQNQPAVKSYESAALHFFEDILNNEELRQIRGCPQKLELYASCLKIVDCLPADKYGRTAKFKLKHDLNLAVRVTAVSLGDAYLETAKKAYYEENRYQKAIERAKAFAEDKKNPAAVTIATRNKRARDEWTYR